MKELKMNNKGQVILLLILVMTVALAIGLSIVQKSLVDVSTASKVEQSSRAFSAAEAGIEKSLLTPCASGCVTFPENNSTSNVSDGQLKPSPATQGNRQEVLEFPPLAKEDVAQVWLADPAAPLPSCAPSFVCYTQTTIDVYWGNSSTDKAALELTLVYYDGTSYQSRKWYLDHTVARNTGFDGVACTVPSLGSNSYQCRKTLGDGNGPNNGPLPTGLMLIRARLLYNVTSQPFAVQAITCATASCSGYSLPSQARTIISTGISGETQRKVKVFQLNKVVPSYFDYAIFSAGDILK